MEQLFKIDESKCSKDGICAAECPLKIIELDADSGFPVPVDGRAALCIECGHCVAVCPHGALTHRQLGPEECMAVDKALVPDALQVEHFLRHRRSIRVYKEKPVDTQTIEELIRLSSFAHSGHNSQPIQWQVIQGRDKVRELSAHAIDWMRHILDSRPEVGVEMRFDMFSAEWDKGNDMVNKGCPVLVLANGDAASPFVDAASKIALTYFELAAPSMGIGTCWSGYFTRAIATWKPLKEALGLPKGKANFGTLMVGVPKYRYSRMPLRKPPKITWA